MERQSEATVRHTRISRFYVKPIADAVWVPGERQAAFARKLGFSQSRILRGSFSCDHPSFAAIHISRIAASSQLPQQLLFVGRFVPQNLLEMLAEAYAIYRTTASEPWPLICCGSGPLRHSWKTRRDIR